jgi:hypothetical protein
VTAPLPEPDDHDPDDWESSGQLPHVHGWIPSPTPPHAPSLEAAVLDLVTHCGGCGDDASVAISVLVSLLAKGECWLHELVADARDQSYSWEPHRRAAGHHHLNRAPSLGRVSHLARPAPGHPIAFTMSVADAFIISRG